MSSDNKALWGWVTEIWNIFLFPSFLNKFFFLFLLHKSTESFKAPNLIFLPNHFTKKTRWMDLLKNERNLRLWYSLFIKRVLDVIPAVTRFSLYTNSTMGCRKIKIIGNCPTEVDFTCFEVFWSEIKFYYILNFIYYMYICLFISV